MPVNKNDAAARAHWGAVYEAIPKSVFAVAAWHLANVASGTADEDGAAEARFEEEIAALVEAGIMPADQGKRALRALRALQTEEN